jgi:hypothetical protein
MLIINLTNFLGDDPDLIKTKPILTIKMGKVLHTNKGSDLGKK